MNNLSRVALASSLTYMRNLLPQLYTQKLGLFLDHSGGPNYEEILGRASKHQLVAEEGPRVQAGHTRDLLQALHSYAQSVDQKEEKKYLLMAVESDSAALAQLKYVLQRYMSKESHLVFVVRGFFAPDSSELQTELCVRRLVYELTRVWNSKSNALAVDLAYVDGRDLVLALSSVFARMESFKNFASNGFVVEMEGRLLGFKTLEYDLEKLQGISNLNRKGLMSLFGKLHKSKFTEASGSVMHGCMWVGPLGDPRHCEQAAELAGAPRPRALQSLLRDN